VVIVDFQLKSGSRAAFRPLVDANAVTSVSTEPGCRRFDVLEPRGEPDRVLLYEIYDDEAAFGTHCRSAHFEQFDRESGPLVSAKSVIRCDLAGGGTAAVDS
jgi:quinol monooxygenase YgiN